MSAMRYSICALIFLRVLYLDIFRHPDLEISSTFEITPMRRRSLFPFSVAMYVPRYTLATSPLFKSFTNVWWAFCLVLERSFAISDGVATPRSYTLQSTSIADSVLMFLLFLAFISFHLLLSVLLICEPPSPSKKGWVARGVREAPLQVSPSPLPGGKRRAALPKWYQHKC